MRTTHSTHSTRRTLLKAAACALAALVLPRTACAAASAGAGTGGTAASGHASAFSAAQGGTASAGSQNSTGAAASAAGGSAALIVYYSRSGNTRALAQQIQQHTGADMLELRPAEAYPEAYSACTEVAKKELRADVYRQLQPLGVDVEKYAIIFVGSPNWWGTWSGPVRTFLHEHALAGKKVYPFATHGGGGWQNMPRDVKKCCPKAQVQEGLSLRGNEAEKAEAKVTAWLKDSGLLK